MVLERLLQITKRKRARTKKGRYLGDDPNTFYFNEAWVVRPAIWFQAKKAWNTFTKWWFKGYKIK